MSVRRTIACVGLIGWVSFLALPVRADVRTEARRHFRQGMALIAEGRAEEGIAALERAYETLPHPNVLYNIGRAYAEAGRYEEAIENFRRYLLSDPADRAEVQGFIAALEQRVEALRERERAASEPAEAPRDVVRSPPAEAAPVASEDEIAALEDSATQIEALAESAQSDALRQRADRLRELAAALRERRVAAGAEGEEQLPPEDYIEPVEPDVDDEEPEEDSALALGEQREGDTYEERVVSASRAAQSPLESPNSTTIVTAQDLRLSGAVNPGEPLRRVAGVELMTASPGDVQISIRGLNQRLSNRAIVLVDGRSVYLDFLGTTIWSLIPLAVEDIERIEVIRGPASALYGADAFTGIVNIITRPIGEGGSFISSGLGNAGQFRLASTVNHRVDRFRFRLGAGYDRANHFARAVGPDRVDVEPFAGDPNLGYDRLYFMGDASVRVSDGLTLTGGTGITTGNRAFQGISRLRELYLQDALFSQTYLQAETDFGLSARTFWNRFQTDYGSVGLRPGAIDGAQQASLPRQDVLDAEVVFQREAAIDWFRLHVIGGVGYRFKEVDWDWIRDPITGNQVETQHHFNGFLQATARFDEWVQVVASARLDRHPLLADLQFSPRGSVVVHPTPRQTVRATVGTAFRSPTFAESYAFVPNTTPVRGVTAFGVGNQSLNPENILSFELGYMFQEWDYFAVELNGYYNRVSNQILLSRNSLYRLHDMVNDPRFGFGAGSRAFPLGQLQFDNEGAEFQQIGGEIGARVYPVDGLDIYVNYAIHETSPVGDRALAGRELDARTSAHKINAGVQYRSSFGLDLSVDFSWVSDQVWVEQVLDTERGGTAFVPFHLPAYTLLNARVGYRLFDDKLELAVVATNIIDEGHRQHPFGQPLDRRVMGSVTYRF